MALINCRECNHQVSSEAEVCPSCGLRLREEKKKPWSTIKTVAVTVLLVFGVGAIWGIPYLAFKNHIAKALAAQEARFAAETYEGSTEVFAVTAERLIADYSANTISADKRYKGKLLRITGTVAEVDTSLDGDPFISVGNFPSVTQLHFPKAAEAQLAQLTQGQAVIAICRGNGETLALPLNKDCYLIRRK